jgi:transmembrane 9 superfamily protein 3
VLLWANHVGPHYNPQETYGYYTLPFCRPDKLEYKDPSIGEALQGMELVKSRISFVFRQNEKEPKKICSIVLNKDYVEKFNYAVDNHYWYQLYLDDLPMWAMVGGAVKKEGTNEIVRYIYTHQKFSIGYNGPHIVQVNLTAENPVVIKEGEKIDFTYSVQWVQSPITFAGRFRTYLDHKFFEHKIHWFSIFNSFMMVLFLAGLVFMILVRTLKTDLAEYNDAEEGYDSDSEFADESGWKQVHGDVFRAPSYLSLFCALVGTGCQLTIIVFALIIFAILGSYYDTRGAMLTSFIIVYSLTSFSSGYISGSLYSKYKGKNWIRTMILTATLFPGTIFCIVFIMNFLAILYDALADIPIGTIISVVALWALITVPLTFLGTIIGRNIAGKPDFPCRVNQFPRPIPKKPWYLNRVTLILLGGLLPFGSIFIEMYFVFTSFWYYKFYYVYGFMLLVFIILIIVTTCVSIVSTYFLLNAEDHRWTWTSYWSASSTAFYVFLYAIYFFNKTKMHGFFQFIFYFASMGIFSIGLSILCGSIGYMGTSIFVRRIYKNIKVD